MALLTAAFITCGAHAADRGIAQHSDTTKMAGSKMSGSKRPDSKMSGTKMSGSKMSGTKMSNSKMTKDSSGKM